MKTAKTPYEIRLDLLQLAYQILSDAAHARCAKEAQEAGLTVVFVTESPSTEAVLLEAERLNSFVSKAQQQ